MERNRSWSMCATARSTNFVVVAPGQRLRLGGLLGRVGKLAAIGGHNYIVSAREKIGKYRDTRTKATNAPMKIMITGSINARVAVIFVFTSSS